MGEMLIKWRQEMGRVGLPALAFQPPPSDHPHPQTTSSAPLTHTDHKPARPDISAASGNQLSSSRCRDVRDPPSQKKKKKKKTQAEGTISPLQGEKIVPQTTYTSAQQTAHSR